MLRHIAAFLPLLLLGGVACAAALALASPASAQTVFLVCLGLFLLALAGGLSTCAPERRE
jgi:hypothetical protein